MVRIWDGKKIRYIAANAIAPSLDADKSRALPAFHAVTDCDTVSLFGWKGKLKASNTRTAFPTVASAFLKLGTEKANLSQNAFEKIEQFVVSMYEKNSTVTTVNAAWQKLFSQRCKAIENISPTQDALRQHTLRAAYRAFVWGHCLHRAPRLPSPSAWRWTKNEGQRRDSVVGSSPTSRKDLLSCASHGRESMTAKSARSVWKGGQPC